LLYEISTFIRFRASSYGTSQWLALSSNVGMCRLLGRHHSSLC
jgi:hypothetical protein